MADNVPITAGSGTNVASDDISGVQFQRIKLTLGGDGTNDGDVASGNPMPVTAALSAAIPAGTNNIGDVDVLSLPALPAGNNNIGDVDVATLPVAFNAGATSATTLRVIEATDAPAVKVDDAAFTPATTAVKMAGFFADEASTDSVDEGDAGAARMTLDRKQIVSVYPSGTGEGLLIFRAIDLDEADQQVKGTAGKVFGWYIYNAAATTRYLKFYNATAASTTVGTTTPIMTIPIPPFAASNIEFTNGIAFATAITVAVTTGVADANTGAPDANDVQANILYV